ncbi:MAG: alpha/beta hydrolase [Novosphingobium sp.]|nr:alpha/beta hydrolase [Novosphingobium sp.]MCP5402186.1 alpha/beta hydrolase [Novosphingobium sp.]
MSATVAIPPERAGRPAPPDLAERREQMGAAVASGVFATKRPPVETTFDGKRTLRFSPESEARGWMLQLHGGGFRIGRPEFEGPFAEALAARCGIEVVVPQYRLAPEGPFPAGLNDALSALTALRAQIGDAPLVVGGDSAGGGLAAALGVLSAQGMAPRIDALVLLSPWLDLTVSAPAYAENADDPMFSKEQADIAAELYLQGFDPTHPLASPLLAPVASLPPTLISVGTGEVLRDDSLRFHDKLLAAGVRSELSAIDGMEHVAVVRSMELTGAAETFEAVAAFVESVLDG